MALPVCAVLNFNLAQLDKFHYDKLPLGSDLKSENQVNLSDIPVFLVTPERGFQICTC